MQTIENLLTGKYYGMVNGHRVYKIKRGHFQVQHPTQPERTCFDGTKREIERVEKSKIVKMYS